GFRGTAISQLHLPLGESLAGRAALERRLIRVPDLDEMDPDFTKKTFLEEESFRSLLAIPLVSKGQVKGVLEIFHRAPLDPDPEWIEFLETLANQAAIAVDNATLFDDLQRANSELTTAYDATIEGWSRALDLRDKETEGHTQRVTEMSLRLARAMGVRGHQLVQIRRGALLHDIGKMGIPDSILLKRGPLDDEELQIMRQHPVYAYEWLSPIPFLLPALEIPYAHHEKWDGTGYPLGLKDEQIPLAARIFAAVDIWDALCSERPYRNAWPEAKVREHIRSLSGNHLDPKVVEVFLQVTSADNNAQRWNGSERRSGLDRRSS
ncbi:HD-GYP domain-containing protein, partial [Singulisphaera rosea]